VQYVKGSSPFIAVVDDEPAVLKALERLFRSAKFEVVTFGSGASFLANPDTRKPDCVVLDLHMPDMNGFDVLSHLSTSPGAKVSVVAISAHDTPTTRQRALEGGAAVYLQKPFDAQTLLSAVRTLIAQSAP
jgi:DNA-binding response OmpR family regulator